MKNIFFITTLLLGSQIASGMNAENLEIDWQKFDHGNVGYEELNDRKSYWAVSNNNDLITADFFTAEPYQGSIMCSYRHTNINGSSSYIHLDKSIYPHVYNQLRDLYESEKSNKPH